MCGITGIFDTRGKRDIDREVLHRMNETQSAILTYRVCPLARRHVTVALSGDGGDESFGGYRRYALHLMEERMRAALPLGLRRPLFGTLGMLYPKAEHGGSNAQAVFNREAIRQIVEQHETGRRDHSTPIWVLLMFGAFLRNQPCAS
jgi:asparagine synthetase B (glutamine-hydrolysing)